MLVFCRRSQFTPPPRLPLLNSGRTAIPEWQREVKPDENSSSQPLMETSKSEGNQSGVTDDPEKEETERTTSPDDVESMNSASEQSTADQQSRTAQTQKEDSV